ncbi:LPS assembly protein LptD [Pseudoalteromonas sp. G4]|uniref:LPS assembly protein LptD n=1 Tax=Pseudoalteromonas sp. G4 TaxID=2992761 RepID=UPI00237DF766|nr:LPS assembly protein LptD [Pseudoalteromonas sp. G4]MDE3273156.1 LPS assembly protein LptD [Pseudoalteromonas sp. G4]
MKRPFGILATLIFMSPIASASDMFSLCETDPNLSWQSTSDLALGQLAINADTVELAGRNKALFSGNVVMDSTQMSLTASSAELDKLNGMLNAIGPIIYQDTNSYISSKHFFANFNSSELSLGDAKYQFTQQAGRGEAKLLEVTNQALLLEDASFTTCPSETPVWALDAKKIKLSQEEGWGETYGAVLKIYDTPVFYLPYFTFPISDKRKSGFIEPTFTSSNRYGLEIETPFYWNIAPNMDATITPRYMANKGFQLQTEFRYLTEEHQGMAAIEYLNSDDSAPELNSRYLLHFSQYSKIDDNWRGQIDITNISDDNYINDMGSSYANRTDTQLNHLIQLTHLGENWHTDFKLQGFEVLGDHLESYRALPQISFNQINAFDFYGFDFTFNGEFAHFQNEEAIVEEATRLHLEPKLSYGVSDYAWSFLSEVSVLQTNYHQQGDLIGSQFEENVNRTLPKLRLYGQINFERDTHWLVDKGLQTLEPKAQYLYIPEKDQSNIGLYDTVKLQDDFYGLFREQRFSGVDRITTANQFTLGATTRIFNQQNNEVFNFSIGQIFYVSDKAKPSEIDDNASYNSLFASEAMLHWHKNWYLSAGLQYDTDGSELVNSHLTLDYKGDNNELIQLNHRYANNVSGNTIEQIGLFASYPIGEQWQLVSSYQRDLESDRSVEFLTGVQYQSCCWAIQLSGSRQIETDLNKPVGQFENESAKFDSSIQIKFIMGLDAQKLLNQSIFSYRRPYFLTN